MKTTIQVRTNGRLFTVLVTGKEKTYINFHSQWYEGKPYRGRDKICMEVEVKGNPSPAKLKALAAKALEQWKKQAERERKAAAAQAKRDKKSEEQRTAKAAGVTVTTVKKLRSAAPRYRSGHSMGCLVTIAVNGVDVARNDCREEYGGRCKYRANHGRVHIDISKTFAAKCEDIGGLLTVRGQEVEPGIHAAKWLAFAPSRGHSEEVEMVSGYLVGNYHADTLESAQLRRDRLTNEQREVELRKMEITAAVEAVTRPLTFADSTAAGNCRAGSAQFCQRHGLDPEKAYTAKQLIALEPNNNYLHRLIKMAAHRNHAEV